MPRLSTAGAAALAALVSVTGCTSNDVSVSVPTPSADAAKPCADLLAAFPHGLAGRSRRSVQPVSPFTAAWGDPAVTLRCGVPPRAPDANATEADIGGVTWRVRRAGDVVQWDAVGRTVGVEVRVPASDNAQENVIGDIGDAVAATIPVAATADAPSPAAEPSQ